MRDNRGKQKQNKKKAETREDERLLKIKVFIVVDHVDIFLFVPCNWAKTVFAAGGHHRDLARWVDNAAARHHVEPVWETLAGVPDVEIFPRRDEIVDIDRWRRGMLGFREWGGLSRAATLAIVI